MCIAQLIALSIIVNYAPVNGMPPPPQYGEYGTIVGELSGLNWCCMDKLLYTHDTHFTKGPYWGWWGITLTGALAVYTWKWPP